MAHPDRPAIPPPPPAMLARDTADMRAQLSTAIEAVASAARCQLAGDETGPGRQAYSGATVDAELAFALYREACRRGLHHSSTEAQAIADVGRYAASDDHASLDEAARVERARIGRVLARPGTLILLRVLADAPAVRCRVLRAIRRNGDEIALAEPVGPIIVAGSGSVIGGSHAFRFDGFLVSWWLDRAEPTDVDAAIPMPPPPTSWYAQIHTGNPDPAPPARKPRSAKPTPKRRRKVG